MKRIFFYVTNITGFNEMSKVADLLSTKRFKISFIVSSHLEGNHLNTIKEKLTAIGADYVDPKENVNGSFSLSLADKMKLKWLVFRHGKGRFDVIKYYRKKKECKRALDMYKILVETHQPDLLIVPEDGPGTNFALLKAFKLMKKNMLVIPYEYSGYEQLVLGARRCHCYRKKDYEPSYYPLFDRCFFYEDGYYYGLQEIESYKALEDCGALPLNLKTVHGGIADKLAAESDKMLEHYQNEKIDKDKLVLTGALSDDFFFQMLGQRKMLKKKLEQVLDEEIEKPVLLFSFIPDSSYPTEKVFSQYSEYITFIAEQLNRLDKYKVIYQFHPAVDIASRKIVHDRGLSVVNLPTAELLLVADLYITSYSSTIRWAIACKVPVINFDIYNFNFKDFKACRGVKHVATRQEFSDLVNDIRYTSIVKELKEAQAEDSGKWAMLDGRSGQRMQNLIDKLCEH